MSSLKSGLITAVLSVLAMAALASAGLGQSHGYQGPRRPRAAQPQRGYVLYAGQKQQSSYAMSHPAMQPGPQSAHFQPNRTPQRTCYPQPHEPFLRFTEALFSYPTGRNRGMLPIYQRYRR